MTSGLETEWDYYGIMGRDRRSKNIGEASKNGKREK